MTDEPQQLSANPTSQIPVGFHRHTSLDGSPQLDPKESLLGFPTVTATPTDTAAEGTIKLGLIAGTAKLFMRISNAWQTIAAVTPSPWTFVSGATFSASVTT